MYNQSEEDPSILWAEIQTIYQDAIKKILGTRKGTNFLWFSDETWKLIMQRKQKQKAERTRKNEEEQAEIKQNKILEPVQDNETLLVATEENI